MRVLVLTPKIIWPLTGGAEIRNFNLLRETAKHHDVYLLSFLARPEDREHFAALRPFCQDIVGVDLNRPKWQRVTHGLQSCLSSRPFILLEYWRSQMAEALQRAIRDWRIDVVHGHFLHVAQYARPELDAAFVFDAHNLEHVLWKRFAEVQTNPLLKVFARQQCGKFVTAQQEVARRSEKIVTLSDDDGAEFRRFAPAADVVTVPNGADVEHFLPQDTAPEPDSILYFGNLEWSPQEDAAIYFHDEILPRVRAERPGAKLYIVGKGPSERLRTLASDHVVVTGFVDDIRESIARAAVVIMPLRVGAGTKHRVFQSLAMRKALVTTSVGAEGIALRHGEHALITDETADFANHVVTLLGDQALRERLGARGRELVLAHHDWRSNYRLLDEAFREAVEKRRRARVATADVAGRPGVTRGALGEA